MREQNEIKTSAANHDDKKTGESQKQGKMKSRAQRIAKSYAKNLHPKSEIIDAMKREIRDEYLAEIDYRVEREIDRIKTSALRIAKKRITPYGNICNGGDI